MRFDISDLQVFVRVAESGSFTRAAERVSRTAAAVSLRIKEMEADFGSALFLRKRDGIVLTESGKRLLSHAYRLLGDVQNMNDDLLEYSGKVGNLVHICCNSVSLREVLPNFLANFLLANKSCQVRVDDLVNDKVPLAVAAGDADIGVFTQPADTRDLEVFPFIVDRYVVVTSPNWPHLKGLDCKFDAVLQNELIGPGRGTWLHTLFQQHAVASGKSFRNRLQVRSFDVTCIMASKGAGVGIVPESTARRFSATIPLRIVQLNESWSEMRLCLCVRRSAEISADARSLLACLMQGANARV